MDETKIILTKDSDYDLSDIFSYINENNDKNGFNEIDEIELIDSCFFDWSDKFDVGKIGLSFPCPTVWTLTNWEIKLHSEYYKTWVRENEILWRSGDDGNLVKTTVDSIVQNNSVEHFLFAIIRLIRNKSIQTQMNDRIMRLNLVTFENIAKELVETENFMNAPFSFEEIVTLADENLNIYRNFGLNLSVDYKTLFSICEASINQRNIFLNSSSSAELKQAYAVELFNTFLSKKKHH
ncbi:MAG: hypothetical protein ACXVCP_08410 [Bdellovibrio sp.]